MREKFLVLANIGMFAGATLVLATLQTSLWLQIFGWFPAPAFWIPVLAHIALQRAAFEGVITIFFLCVVLSTMTATPSSLLFVTLLGLAGAVRLVKQRIYWAGSSYIMMVSGFAALVWHLIHWAGAVATSPYPLGVPEITDWLIQALLTPLIAPPLDELFRWFDKITERETGAEASIDAI